MSKLLFVLATCLFATANSGVPIATGGPSLIYEGKDALLTCVVSENRANNTVIWKKSDEILTAGMVRVTSDNRLSILHDENPKGRIAESGGEVWVLLIKRLKPSDSGSYICELNSEPVLRSIHILSVKPLPNRGVVVGGTNSSATTTEASDVFLIPPPLDSGDNRSFWRPRIAPQITHDFTECCEKGNVTSQCMGFCNVHNILDGTTGIEPEACEKDFPTIVRCMADGRNHVPCCIEKHVPDLCQDMCRGEYTPFTDLLKTRVSCLQHTLSGLECILQGVQNIPSTPTDVTVEETTETSIRLSWSPPDKLAHKIDQYFVNITALHSFENNDGYDEDDDDDDDDEDAKAQADKLRQTKVYKLPANQTSILLSSLTPSTMYGIVVTAVNDYGSSLPSERVRTFTHISEEDFESKEIATASAETTPPDLPDIRSCCEANGMTHRMCLDKMCDPQKTDLATLPDFMVCAPWSNITFHCLANHIDHTPCCRARGIPAACFPLCAGKITTLDFSLFKCLRFMSEYSSCLFQGYGVLAGPPNKLRTIAKTDNFVILNWNRPKLLPETIQTYHVKFRRLGVGDDYLTVEKKLPPLVLEGLEPDVYYEFYVVSVNAYGKSEASPRLITRTLPAEVREEVVSGYNMTTCCKASGLLPQCAPLCSYNIRLSDIEKLGPGCRAQMPVIARCAAGGRDHTPCCNRRGVIPACLTLCRGVMPVAPSSMSSPDCLSYAGNILQCLEEGTKTIPAPVEDLRVTFVSNTTISLAWAWSQSEQQQAEGSDGAGNANASANATKSSSSKGTKIKSSSTAVDVELSPSNGEFETIATIEAGAGATVNSGGESTAAAPSNGGDDDDTGPIDFIVQYGKVNNMTMYETVARLENELITNETSTDLTNLEPNALYRIVVVSHGRYGSSLPSSMLLINTTNHGEEEKAHNKTFGAPSPPHSLAIISQSATWMQLTWQPPEYSHPHENIIYRVYHKPMKADKFNTIETKIAWLRMNNLKPSSQHILYVEAIGEKATSLPSETLVAWTDPAIPAFVDPPTVHPADNIPEGASMTILCLALGNPAPTISLYVGGHLVRQDTSRHMVTVIHNITADMEHVSCYADNGYGVPMQATRRVNICYPPKIQAAGITVAAMGDEVELRCIVDAKPSPKTIFWRDHDGRVPVIQGGNYDISTITNESRSTLHTMTLRIKKLQNTDGGDYFCHAENAFGSSTMPVSVRIRSPQTSNRNITECCTQMNVSSACRSACSYYVDIDAIAERSECILEYDKLMKCAADGSDHRPCCADANVPRKCLNWCRGEVVRAKEICSLQYARTIIGCFETNHDRLPGPPENIAVNVISDNEVVIRWDPPSKNPNVVDGYRIFYHEAIVPTPNDAASSSTSPSSPTSAETMSSSSSSSTTPSDDMGSNSSNATSMHNVTTEIRRIDVKDTSVNIDGLKKDVLYELVVKASNSYGASVLTDPIKFTLGEHHVTSATTYSSTVGTISGVLAGILAILLAAAAIIFYRRHRANASKASSGVAFENPTYTRGLEQVQLPTVTSAITSHNGGSSVTNTQASSMVTHVSPAGLSGTMAATGIGGSGVGVNNNIHNGINGGMNGSGGHGGGSGFSSRLPTHAQMRGGNRMNATTTTSAADGHDTHTQYNEVNPTIYEELKLGQEGAGFKKLVP